MDATTTSTINQVNTKSKTGYLYLIRPFIFGMLLTLSFAPFHYPGLAILGISLLFYELRTKSYKQSLMCGLMFGFGFMGFGVSWVYTSIHLYGNLNIILSSIVTLAFITYLAIFYSIVTGTYTLLKRELNPIASCLLFSSLWCLGEFLRANFASGFPWLLIGFGQIDTFLKYLLPFIGVYGVSFLTCLSATFLGSVYNSQKHIKVKIFYLFLFVSILLLPNGLKNIKTSDIDKEIIPVSVVQANLSMRDKWDEKLLMKIIDNYRNGIIESVQKARLIVLPESAIPVLPIYISDIIAEINYLALKYKATVLLGIPVAANKEETLFYNTITSYGHDNRVYKKQHLVPFGEYIPKPFKSMANLLNIPDAGLLQNKTKQTLLKHNHKDFATLICFEVAYPELLRKQMPKAQWIVSVSDAGWFGHSLAIYQQIQMSQVLSMQTGRYQIVANNNGLSSIIDNNGNIINSLPAFSSMNLYGDIHPASNSTFWIKWGDKPYLYLCIVISIIALLSNRSYPCRSTKY